MAEGLSEKVYFTRSRKRSIDPPESRTSLEHEEAEQEKVVIDLTSDDSPVNSHIEVDINNLECAICLQSCVHPARLPCGHIFCFLCVKGAAHGNRKCAMCRSPIPHNYFNNPDLLETPKELTTTRSDEEYEWFYEGRNGWWQYDPRATKEIETAWEAGHMECELLIAGYLYTIDFRDMCQYRKGQPSKIRRIKRDLATSEKIGIAGLRDPSVAQRRCSEGDKGRHEERDYDSHDTPRRSSLESSGTSIAFLEEQFSELALTSDDDDSYQ